MTNTIKYKGQYCPCRWNSNDELEAFYDNQWELVLDYQTGD